MMILLTLYLVGMPLAFVTLIWALTGLPDDDWQDLYTLPGFAAMLVFVVLWPVFLTLCLADMISER